MFVNRQEAGRRLAQKLIKYQDNSVVFGLTRGGIVVAKEISSLLDISLFPIIVKKIGAWQNPELAIGALTYQKTLYIDYDLVKKTGTTKEYLAKTIEEKWLEVKKLKRDLRLRLIQKIFDKQAIVVDDGIATGASVKAVIKFLQSKSCPKIILAVPVIAKDTYLELVGKVWEIIALEIPATFCAVGQFYQKFPQVEDKEVGTLLCLGN